MGPASDVYSMGAVLYQLLAGQSPYASKRETTDASSVIRAVREGPPTPLDKIGRPVSAELVAICEKAMHRLPEDRYPNMGEMARDLRAYLENRVVRAHRTGAWVEFRKWVRRNKGMAASLLGIFVALAAAVVVSFFFLGQAKTSESRAKTALANESSALVRESEAKDRAQGEAERARRAEKRAISLSAIKRLQELEVRAEQECWPRRPGTVASMQTWIEEARREESRIDDYREYYAELDDESQTEGLSQDEREWLREKLGELIASLEALTSRDPQTLGLLPDVENRLAFSESLESETIDTFIDEWATALDDISANELYAGLELDPIVGLVPLEPDPQTSYWEFLVWESGSAPKRTNDGRYFIENETGIILVLLPGGAFTQGNISASNPTGRRSERPLGTNPSHEVTLSPFFLSKYEVTQGQFLRHMGHNPSFFNPNEIHVGPERGFAHPVEEVTWHEAASFAMRIGLQLPTESQWEYGARAGTRTPWPVDMRQLRTIANLADQDYAQRFQGPRQAELWSDGWSAHAPVGSLGANPFGLHDMHGNVWEWCADWFSSYTQDKHRRGDGLMQVGEIVMHQRARRGGSFGDMATNADSAWRSWARPEATSGDQGFRVVLNLDLE